LRVSSVRKKQSLVLIGKGNYFCFEYVVANHFGLELPCDESLDIHPLYMP